MPTQEMQILNHEKQILEYENTIQKVKDQNCSNPLWSQEELHQLEGKLEQLKKSVYGKLTAWERIAICRHPSRPKAKDYIKHICDEFEEICGDRNFRDDHAIVAGMGMIQGQKFMIIGQEKGSDTTSRIKHNFGMPHPEGYRKAMRCMRLAAKFNIPVITLIDTPGAYCGLTAEERGQGWAIANNLWEMARLPTPIIVVLIGEGCSGGALGIGVGDHIAMLEHAYYSVISPEGCASILWKDSQKNELAAKTLKLHAEELIKFGVIDTMLKEPLGGAHHDPLCVYKNVKEHVLEQWSQLKEIAVFTLLEQRYQKFRKIGKFTEEGSSQ